VAIAIFVPAEEGKMVAPVDACAAPLTTPSVALGGEVMPLHVKRVVGNIRLKASLVVILSQLARMRLVVALEAPASLGRLFGLLRRLALTACGGSPQTQVCSQSTGVVDFLTTSFHSDPQLSVLFPSKLQKFFAGAKGFLQ